MDYYINANEQLDGAKVLAEAEKYRLAVTLLCLSCELFIKSLVELKAPNNPLLDSHDIVGLGRLVRNDVDYVQLAPNLAFLRKYLNDSRYPFNVNIYTQEFYEECLEKVLFVRKEIDLANAKKSNIEKLSKKFGSNNVTDETKKS